jgi:hypothetical protein
VGLIIFYRLLMCTKHTRNKAVINIYAKMELIERDPTVIYNKMPHWYNKGTPVMTIQQYLTKINTLYITGRHGERIPIVVTYKTSSWQYYQTFW